MATNPALREALLKELGGISPQALSQRVKRRKKQLPMSTEDAAYTIAHEQGIDISKYLDEEVVARVRNLVAQLPREASESPPPRRRQQPRKPTLVTIRAFDVPAIPGLTAAHAKEAKDMAERVYPTLYVFENSARDVITRVLADVVGKDWWTKCVSKNLQNKAATRQAEEGKEPWHGRRGGEPIQYIDLPDLAQLVRSGKVWPHFEALDLFPRASWFEELVSDMNVSRRVIAHMNPLDSDDIKNVEAAFSKWSRQLEARKDNIP